MKKFVLIDGHSLLFRAYHALPKVFSDKEGRPTNAVYGFMSMLLRVIKDLKPDYLVVAFDEAAPTLRHADLITYKEGRPEMDDDLKVQQPILRELLQSFSVPAVSIEGYEGEDVIATIVAKIQNSKSKSRNSEVFIVSGDRDVLQLVNRKVKVYSPKKGISDAVVYDHRNAGEVFGVSPSQIPDYKGLRGDPSDRIPGVFGIGEKTAIALIEYFHTVENLYKNIDQIRDKFGKSVEKKLVGGAESAVLSKRLAMINDHAPFSADLDSFKYSDFKVNVRGLEFLSRLGFKSIIKRLTGIEELPVKNNIKANKSFINDNQIPLI